MTFKAAFSDGVGLLSDSPIKTQMQGVLKAWQAGVPLEGALRNWGKFTKNEKIESLVGLINQALKCGTPLEELLLKEAELIKEEYFLMLEKKAQAVSIKLLFPIVIFIFPPIFVILFGPLMIQVFQMGFVF